MNEENQTNKTNEISESEQIKELLEQNLEMSKEIYSMTKKIKSYVNFQKFLSIFYLLIIVVPIILSIIYLPPLLNGLFNQYKDILNLQGGSSSTIQGLLNGGNGGLDINTVKSLLNK